MENFEKQLDRIKEGLLPTCHKKYETLVRDAVNVKGDKEKNSDIIRKLNYLKIETTNVMSLPQKYVELAKKKRSNFKKEESFLQELDMLYNEALAEAIGIKSELNFHIK